MTPTPYYDDGFVTIYHGDCREILPTIPQADMVLTDPPYGIKQADWDHDLLLDWWTPTLALLGGSGAAYVFGDSLTLSRFQVYWEQRGTVWRSRIVWAYESGPRHERAWTSKHEDCLFWRGPDHHLEVPTELSRWQDKRWGDDRYLGDVWSVPRVQGNDGLRTIHPTQKPLALFQIPIRASSVSGALVVDPFMGSGTTLRAAKDLGRRAIGIELEERYCEIAAKRCAQDVLFGDVAA